MTPLRFPRENNLDWLRLVFALQVVLVHASGHFHLPQWPLLSHLPGVPAFFFASGFLIYASYRNAPGRTYLQNRFLRLMPALVFVTLGGLVVALIARGPADLLAHPLQYAAWFVAQITIGQAYNPALFRDVGVGVINGALWTITTEVLFYAAVPLIVWAEQRFRHAVVALTVLSFAVYALGPSLWNETLYRDKDLYDFMELTPLAWGWMFGVGILAVKHFARLATWIRYFPLALLPMAVLIFLNVKGPLLGTSGNSLGVLYFLPYAAMVLFLAFGMTVIKLPFDLSYGVYIWHMPVINLMLVLGAAASAGMAVGLTLILAAASWIFIEKPALQLKRRTIRTST